MCENDLGSPIKTGSDLWLTKQLPAPTYTRIVMQRDSDVINVSSGIDLLEPCMHVHMNSSSLISTKLLMIYSDLIDSRCTQAR